MIRVVGRRPVRDEAGASLVMAMIVMLVLTTLSMALLGRTLSVMGFVRNGQDYDAALASADAGLADALFKIDQAAPATWTATGASGGGTFQYWAQKQSDSKYIVSSVGSVGDAHHAIQALVTRSAQFPYALFSDQRLRFAGTSALGVRINFYSFNRLYGQPDKVRVGSNDTVICEGPPDPNVYIDWYNTQSDCSSDRVVQLEKPRDMSISEPPLPHQACPAGGVFGVTGSVSLGLTVPLDLTNPTVYASTPKATVDGKSNVQAGGIPYVCRQDVKLQGLIEPVNGPVKIYILPTINADGTKTYHSLDISNSIVNPFQPASNFQIFKTGNVPMTTTGNTVSNLTYRGVIFAPETPMTVNGGLWWAGSFNFSQINVSGSPNIKIGYDFDLDTYLGPDWRVSRYREIPSSEAAPVSSTTTTAAPVSTTSTTAAPTTTTAAPATTTTTCVLGPLGVCI